MVRRLDIHSSEEKFEEAFAAVAKFLCEVFHNDIQVECSNVDVWFQFAENNSSRISGVCARCGVLELFNFPRTATDIRVNSRNSS